MPSAVRITARERAAGSTRRDFGRTLFLHQGDATATDLDTIVRERQLRTYGSQNALEDDWPADHAVRAAGARYFAQSPYPGPMLVAGWFNADVVGRILGGTDRVAAGSLSGLGTFTLQIGNTVTGNIDFGSVSTYAGAATALQTALAAAITGATCTYSVASTRFELTFPADANIAGGFVESAATRALGLFSSATVLPGIEAEANISVAASRVEGDGRDWWGVTIDPNLPAAQRTAMKTWAEARRVMFGYDFHQVGALTTNETTSEGAVDFAAQRRRTFAFWSRTIDHKSLSLLGRFAAQNLTQPGSYISGAHKVLPGCAPDMITDGQQDELRRKRVNFYVPDLGQAGLVKEGWTFETWFDHVWSLDWITDALEVAYGNLLTSSPVVPQDANGRAQILRVLDQIGNEAVRNGMVSPGSVSESFAAEIRQVTGNANFDGDLPRGFFPYVGLFSDQSVADRTARKSPPVYFFGRFRGAVHSIEGTIVFGI